MQFQRTVNLSEKWRHVCLIVQ